MPTLVYFGRFSSNKGLDRLIDAFDAFCDEIPRARLHIMGRDWDDVLPASGSAYGAARHGTAVTVHEEPNDDDIRRVIAASSFFVSASQYEGFGLTLVEALAAGLLPIVSTIPSFASILGGSRTGLPVQFDDAEGAGRDMASFIRESRRDIARVAPKRCSCLAATPGPRLRAALCANTRTLSVSASAKSVGVRIHSMSRSRAVSKIDRAFAAGQQLNVSFANAHTLNLASTDDRFRAALHNFFVLNDGLGVDIASRYKYGRPFAANLNGTDFIPDFLESTRHRLRIYLVGTSDCRCDEGGRTVARTLSAACRCGATERLLCRTPQDIEETCRNIHAARADCVLVGMGNPQQELWIEEFGAKTGARLLFGVGALFDFEAGSVRRAPKWIRGLRCEWLYRLLQEPKRLARRYVVGNFGFLFKVLIEARHVRHASSRYAPRPCGSKRYCGAGDTADR